MIELLSTEPTREIIFLGVILLLLFCIGLVGVGLYYYHEHATKKSIDRHQQYTNPDDDEFVYLPHSLYQSNAGLSKPQVVQSQNVTVEEAIDYGIQQMLKKPWEPKEGYCGIPGCNGELVQDCEVPGWAYCPECNADYKTTPTGEANGNA